MADEVVHWTSDAPTSLHGNGAWSFTHVTTERQAVTCRLCLTLLRRGEDRTDAPEPNEAPAEADAGSREEPCDECEGTGVTVQGWTDKNGYSEDQYGPCFTCIHEGRIERREPQRFGAGSVQ